MKLFLHFKAIFEYTHTNTHTHTHTHTHIVSHHSSLFLTWSGSTANLQNFYHFTKTLSFLHIVKTIHYDINKAFAKEIFLLPVIQIEALKIARYSQGFHIFYAIALMALYQLEKLLAFSTWLHTIPCIWIYLSLLFHKWFVQSKALIKLFRRSINEPAH